MTFYSGARIALCDVEIINDTEYEDSEFFLLRLAEPEGCQAQLGDLDVALITIADPEDGMLRLVKTDYNIRTRLLSKVRP